MTASTATASHGETESACGQGVIASGCGQEEPSSCGQETAVSACGQESVQTSCGQSSKQVLNSAEMTAWRSFLAAATSVTSQLNRELEVGLGISMHEYEILVRLSEAPGRSLRMSELADHVSHSRSRLTHTVARLERAGLVERYSCSSDRRGVNCILGESGLKFLREAAPVHLDGIRRHVIDKIDSDQLPAFTEMMSRLVETGDEI